MNIEAIWTSTPVRIADATQELAFIDRAKNGDQDAILALMGAYIAVLRSAVGKYAHILGRDDARQAAFEGLMRAVAAFDPAKGRRLATVIRQHVADTLASAAGEAGEGFTIPERTLKRFFGILAKADGDVPRAAELAPKYEMTQDTFYGVLQAVRSTGSLEAHLEADGDTVMAQLEPVVADREFVDVEDRVLVEMAFAAVDDLEAKVCRMAYGFDEHYRPLPDAEIGAQLGMSRLKALRTRQRALTKMRHAVGA